MGFFYYAYKGIPGDTPKIDSVLDVFEMGSLFRLTVTQLKVRRVSIDVRS